MNENADIPLGAAGCSAGYSVEAPSSFFSSGSLGYVSDCSTGYVDGAACMKAKPELVGGWYCSCSTGSSFFSSGCASG